MPERRKSPEELQAEIEQRASGEPTDDQIEGFEAFSEPNRAAANDVFRTLMDAGYMTTGEYQYRGNPQGPDTLTLTVMVEDVPAAGDHGGE